MTPVEARKITVGSLVVWEPSNERGKVVEKGPAGIRVHWEDDTDAVYLYTQTAHGLLHLKAVK